MSDADKPAVAPEMTADELRASWPGRALAYVRHQEQLGPVVLSLIADNFDDAMPFLLRAVFPQASGVRAPFYCTSPKINKAGVIVADIINRDGTKTVGRTVFLNERQMEAVFRTLADRLKFSDDDRRDLFRCIHHWVKADMRLDPTMDRRDPDAKRLVVH